MKATSPCPPTRCPQSDSLALLPDAFTPTLSDRCRPALARGKLHKKKAEILAAARRLLAEEGWAKLSMRKLAAECHVSRQTIHNITGSKIDLIAAAICDHTAMMHSHVASRYQGEEYVIELTEHLIEVVRTTPEYSRRAISAYFAFDLPVFRRVNDLSLKMNFAALSSMQRAGVLRSDVDLIALNCRIVESHTVCILNWAHELISSDEFTCNMRMGCKLLLFGALKSSTPDFDERWPEERHAVLRS